MQPSGPFLGKRAIVIGGSVTGLLAARVLADFFEKVVIVERDYLYDRPIGRKGVPQARHSHILLAAGASVIGELLPEILDDMQAAGAIPVDASKDLRWFHYGVWKARKDSGITLYLTNRMVLETAIRAQVRRWTNIEILDERDIINLEVNRSGERVVGVRCEHKGEPTLLEADLVIDASGRGSRSPRWLSDAGFSRVEETEVRMSIGYASRVYRMPRSFPVERLPLAVFPKPPESRRMGILFTIDEKILMVTLGGWCRDYPPTQHEGFVEFARSLPVDDFQALLDEAKPAPAIHPHLVPSNLRRRYERMRRFPDGYVVLGDALCSFNPIYGQGMSAAALEVKALQSWLERARARGHGVYARGAGRQLQRRVAREIRLPWLLATTEDFRFPETTGRRPFGLAFLQWYIGHILELSATHPEILRRFMLVMNLLSGPLVLLTPSIILTVLVHSLRGRPSAALGKSEPPVPPEIEGESAPELGGGGP
ncbi:MAG: hypothetical protein R3A79_00075 [Nannocystaceae bacterium]